MPFISTRTTVSLTEEKKDALTAALGRITENCLNKSESWLMTGYEDQTDLYFKGKRDEDLVYTEVKLCGDAGRAAYSQMTAQVCALFEKELGIPADHIYVSYFPTDHWGWNGTNF